MSQHTITLLWADFEPWGLWNQQLNSSGYEYVNWCMHTYKILAWRGVKWECNQKDVIVLPISIHTVVENLVKRPKKLQYLFNKKPRVWRLGLGFQNLKPGPQPWPVEGFGLAWLGSGLQARPPHHYFRLFNDFFRHHNNSIDVKPRYSNLWKSTTLIKFKIYLHKSNRLS